MTAMVTAGFVVAALCLTIQASAQTPPYPIPSGNRIVASDGDVIIIDNDARVRVVRRRDANVRAVFNADERWLVLLVDYAAGRADGRVDMAYSYNGVRGDWPLGSRWEGLATIEEYSTASEGRRSGLGVITPAGVVQFLGQPNMFNDPAAVAVLSFSGSSSGAVNSVPFDQAERSLVEQVRRNGQRQPSLSYGVAGGVTASIEGGGVQTRAEFSSGGPVRVGGNVAAPKKILDTRPVMPAEALSAGIRGVVILEITIDADGVVSNARVLRSIPLLDQATLDAVRQWRFEPTTTNGQSVPVIMTVSVPMP